MDATEGTEPVPASPTSSPKQGESGGFVANGTHSEIGNLAQATSNQQLEQVQQDSRHHWLQPSAVFCRKMLTLLEKCHLKQTLDKSRVSF